MSRRWARRAGRAGLGGAGQFTPLSLSPVLWLRADLGVTLNGSNVSAWADQSGAGNNFTQGNATYQPPLVTALAALNNQAAVGPFTGSGAKALLYAGASSYAGPWTMMVVYYLAVAPVINRYIFGNENTNRGDLYVENSAGGTQHALTNKGANDITSAGSGVGAHCLFVDELAAGSKLFIDSTTAAATGAAGATSTMFASSTAAIGSYALDTTSDTYNYPGYVAEIALYNRTLSATEKGQILAYSRVRYATP